MGHQFKAIIERSIVLTVKMPYRLVGNIQNLFRVGGKLPATINFQFNTEVAAAIPIKNGIWFEVVVMDVAELFVAAMTVGDVIVIIEIVGIFIGDQPAASIASGVEISLAAVTEGDVVIAFIFFLEYPFATAVTGGCQFLKAVFTVELVIEIVCFTGLQNTAAVNTGMVAHI